MADPKIRITADTSQAERAIKNLDKALEDLNEQAAAAGKFFAGLSAAAAGATYAILKTIGAAGDIVDAAKAIGISASSLETLQTAAQLAGVSAEGLNNSMIRLSSTLGESLAKGSGPAVDAMNRLGLDIAAINNLKPDEQFKRVSEQLLAIQNPAERTALAMDLFGKQGPKILAVAGELEKVKQITEDIGFGITERELIALDEASDSVDQLRIIWDAGVKKAVAEIAPYIVAIVNEVKSAIKEAGGFEAIWAKITSVLRSVVNVLAIIGTILVARVVVGAAAFAVQLGKALIAARGVSAVLARTPIGLLTAGAAILAEKFGVDLVGGAGEFLDINLDIAAAQKQINDALEDSKKNLESNKQAQEQLNEEKKKALAALDDTVQKLGQNVQFQKDINEFGEEEADIRRLIAQEAEKLKKVNLEMTPQQEQMLRMLKEEENSVKRIITLRKEQASAIDESMFGGDPLAKEFEKLIRLRQQFEQGMTNDDIQKNAEKRALALNDFYKATMGKDMPIVEQEGRLRDALNATISKNNKLYAIENKHESDIRELHRMTSILRFYGAKGGEKELQAINAAKEQIEANYQMEIIQLQNEAFANFGRLEDLKIQRAAETHAEMLRMQKDFLGNQMFNNEQIRQIAADRAAFEKKTTLEQTKFGIDQAQTVFAALGAQNKKAFEASKALAVASAVMNTYQGATKALATYPWPFGLIAAAAAVAAGFAQVNAIKSQQYSGRALGGPVTGTNTYLVGERGPELFSPNTNGTIIPNNQLGGGGTTNVNFTIVANDTAGFDELLTSRRGVITQIISDAMLERGQRM